MPTLTPSDVADFIDQGFVRIDDAFSRRLAEDCRALIWRDLGWDPNEPATWTHPVVRLTGFGQPPFARTVNTPRLHAAFDQLVGAGSWRPRRDVGTLVLRFPHREPPQDTGWHIDSSFPDDAAVGDDYAAWRVNLHSRGRALLMLFLFSDVGEKDAPTRIRVGSHRVVARLLEPFGEAGVIAGDLQSMGLEEKTADHALAFATGAAGTVYLCHPFLVHAAQAHRGSRPRLLSQPELPPARPFLINQPRTGLSPVEEAIHIALQEE